LTPLQAQTTGTVEYKGTIKVPQNARLGPNDNYSIQLQIDGKRINGTFVVDPRMQSPRDSLGKTAPPPPPTEKNERTKEEVTPPTDSRIPVWIWGLIGLLALSLIAAGWFFWQHYYVKPKHELDPYWRALIAVRDRRYKSALPDLTSIESKLPPELRQDARFFIALCCYHVEDLVEAEHQAAALYREDPENENVACLLAHLFVERSLDEEAEPILERLHARDKLDVGEARTMLSIVKFRLGMKAIQANDIEAAAEYFSFVEQLGLFTKYIPSDLRNRHITLGTRALFDQDLPAARKHFEALRTAARDLEEENARPLLVKAAVGLVLVQWLEKSDKDEESLEDALWETALLIHADGPKELPWPEISELKDDPDALRRALEEADKNFELPADEQVFKLCLRDLHFLRAMHIIITWGNMESSEAGKKIEKRLERILSRLACARAIDERFADTYLVAGLLMFYLHKPGPERTAGVDLLEQARKLGARDPAAMEIISNRERIERENADAIDRYQLALDEYLHDETVRKEVREDLFKRLMTLQRLKSRYKPPDLSQARTVDPTVEEMRKRSETLREHILALEKSTDNMELAQQSTRLAEQADELTKMAKLIEETEKMLLILAGEELFKDI